MKVFVKSAFTFPPQTFCEPLFHFLSCTLGFRQTEDHAGGRHQNVCEDGSISHGQRGGALLQQVQNSTSHVPGHVTTDIQKYRHVLVTEWSKELDQCS